MENTAPRRPDAENGMLDTAEARRLDVGGDGKVEESPFDIMRTVLAYDAGVAAGLRVARDGGLDVPINEDPFEDLVEDIAKTEEAVMRILGRQPYGTRQAVARSVEKGIQRGIEMYEELIS